MAKVRDDQPLVPSVLDRLIDETPGATREPPKSQNQVLRDLRASVQRDLENLLNTRWRCVEWPPNLDELTCSLVNYGIPDFTGAHMSSSDDLETLRQVIEKCIEVFEPRFVSFTIRMLERTDPGNRSIRFRIDGLLRASPAPEPVIFDSQLQPVTGHFDVTYQRR